MSDEASAAQTAQPEGVDAIDTVGDASEEPTTADGAGNNESTEAQADTDKAAVGDTKDVVTDNTEDNATDMLRTKARADPKNYSANVKSDASVLPESSDPRLIRSQVSCVTAVSPARCSY
jgi:hypothetical protein